MLIISAGKVLLPGGGFLGKSKANVSVVFLHSFNSVYLGRDSIRKKWEVLYRAASILNSDNHGIRLVCEVVRFEI